MLEKQARAGMEFVFKWRGMSVVDADRVAADARASAKIKILNFALGFPPPLVGGGIQYLYNIISRFPAGSVVTHTARNDPAADYAHDRGFSHRVLRSRMLVSHQRSSECGRLKRLWCYIWWPAAAFLLILRERPDVVFVAETNGAAIAALTARRLLGIPYLHIVYAGEVTSYERRPLRDRYFWAIARDADAILTVCEFTRRLLAAKGVHPSRIHKVLPSVGEEKAAGLESIELEEARRKYGLEGRRVLLTVANLLPRKGHDLALRALPHIIKNTPRAKYVIAGTGEEEQRLRELTGELALHPYVHFAGRVSNHDLCALYELCDVFVLANHTVPETRDTEGCPTVLLEAAAHGKPTIAGNAGGVEDAVQDGRTGFIVNANDAQALANAAILLLNDGELARTMGEAGRRYVADLKPENTAAAVWEITRTIMGNGRT